jgi:hypothetical protein
MRYDIEVPILKLKKRKAPAESYTVYNHTDAAIVLMQASNNLRLAVVKVDNVQVGCTIKRCNQEWTWDLLEPLQIMRTLKDWNR